MSNLVDKVKQKLRSRSSSRSSLNSPVGQANSRNSTDIPDVPKISDRDRDRNAQYPPSPTSRQDAFPRTSLENSAFHVSRGPGGRSSFDSGVARKPLPPTNSNLNPNSSTPPQHRTNHSLGGQQSAFEEAIPNRRSSRHATDQDYGIGHNQRQSVEERIPDRDSSRFADTSTTRAGESVPSEYNTSEYGNSPARRATRRVSIPERLAPKPQADSELSKPLPHVPAAYGSGNTAQQYPANGYDNITQPTAAYDSGNMARQDGNFANAASSTHDPMSNSAWMSPMISKGHNRRASSPPRDNDAAKYETMASGHLRLPEGFNLQNTEETHVYETQRPAVTHETIVKQRTEIIREEITRDIHMHHYFTYQQPIKLVEILPPRHFFLNLETGEKTEIDPPFGWSMPPNMFPVSPNTSHLAGYTRHYLVNDQFPYGVPEDAPVEHGSTINNRQADNVARAM